MKIWVQIINEKLHAWWIGLIKLMPNLLVAILVAVITIITARFFKKLFYKISIKFSGKSSVSGLFSTVIQVIIFFTGLFIILDVLQLDQAVTSLLAGAGIIGIILGFAFQDITANFIAGIYIAIKKPFDLGHTIKTNDFMGNVEDIQLRSTVIRTFSGLHLMIPNRDIIQKPMINYSLTAERRIEMEFFINSSVDLLLVYNAITNSMNKINYLYAGKTVEIYFNDFKDNAIKIFVWFWIDNHKEPGYMVARHDAIIQIMNALKEINVSLVVPVSLQELSNKN